MKNSNNLKIVSLLGALFFSALVIITSCKKSNMGPGGSGSKITDQNEQTVQQLAQRAMDKISEIKIVKETDGNKINGKVIGTINMRSGGFTFADGNEGFNFSSSNGVEYVSTSGGGILFISAGSFGGNAAGGTVQAGTSSLQINYTFCMSADDSSMNLNFFGPSFTGVSMVLGISGNFEDILNGTATDSTIMDAFNGMAMYVIYSDEASGNYPIVNWIANADSINNSDNLGDLFANKGFAWVLDFKKPGIYFSSEGELNVSGGSIGFTGKYLAILPEEGKDFFDLGGDIEFQEVDGLGVMGCN